MFREKRSDRSEKMYNAVRKQLLAVAHDGKFPTALIADDEGLLGHANSIKLRVKEKWYES